jgi:hypothetical protein
VQRAKIHQRSNRAQNFRVPTGFIPIIAISNVHEAEHVLRSMGCAGDQSQRATARFLAASQPDYEKKTLTLAARKDWTLGDIFDAVGDEAPPKLREPHPTNATYFRVALNFLSRMNLTTSRNAVGALC